MSLNKVIILGNLTRDPELKFLQTGKAVCGFGIASNRKWKTDSGEEKEDVYFGECTAWGKTGEVIAQYFRKGKPILVEGRLSTETWDDKTTGKKQSKTRIVVEGFSFAGGDDRAQGTQPAPRQAAAPKAPVASDADESDTSVPF